ncbi:MAG: flagellar M-ring protein FliF [Dehalococcoidia bacterium]|nr:MAG: flagellar M-ring protein FliF [Dehalococcoidia bacterium]
MGSTTSRLFDIWGGLSPARKGMLTATAIGLVAIFFFVYSWSGRTEFVTLYSGLDPADSGRIVEQLRAQGVPYQVDGGGTSVRVDAAKADDMRVNFAAQGLPQGGSVGFEIFQNNQFTATDFVQRLNFQRGLQGELARTIESFPAVEHARVHLVLPEKSLFAKDQQPATASVVVALRPGKRLQGNEVNGIAHLVSGAVQGLSKDRITILDQSGAMIFDGGTQKEDGFGMTASQLGLQQQYEQSLSDSAQGMLDRALGPSKATVSVRAAMNFDRGEVEKETFTTPEKGTPRSSSTVTEQYTTAAGLDTAGQIPGALANVPGANGNLPAAATPAASAGGGTNYQRSETTSNFEVDRTKTKSTLAPGKVQRLTVSLILDESVPQEQLDALKANVSAAVGLDDKRGDTIAVSRVKFDRSAIEEAQKAFKSDASQQRLMGYARLLLPVIVLALGFVFFRTLMKSVGRRAGGFSAYDSNGVMLPVGVGGSSMQLAQAQAAIRALPSPDAVIQKSDLEISVERLASSNPDSVVEVVQSWLRED